MEQFATRLKAETLEAIYAYADQQEITLAEPAADTVAPLLSASIEQKQQILETRDVVARLESLIELMRTGRPKAVAKILIFATGQNGFPPLTRKPLI